MGVNERGSFSVNSAVLFGNHPLNLRARFEGYTLEKNWEQADMGRVVMGCATHPSFSTEHILYNYQSGSVVNIAECSRA